MMPMKYCEVFVKVLRFELALQLPAVHIFRFWSAFLRRCSLTATAVPATLACPARARPIG